MATVTRGKILRGDLANFDGRNTTATRVDATGGTITGLAIGNEVDVLQVYGDGVNRTYGTLRDAVTKIGAANVTISIAPGTWNIDSSLTIPSNITVHIPSGAIFDVAAGEALTINGSVIAESSSWWSGSGTVNGRASKPGIFYTRTSSESALSLWPTDHSYEEADSRRYGALFDGSTDDSAAHQLALDVLAQKGGGTWIIAGGITRAQNLVCLASDITIDHQGGWIKPVSNDANEWVLKLGNDSTPTRVLRARGRLRIGDPVGHPWTWNELKGLFLENATECQLSYGCRGMGVALALNSGNASFVAYNNFYLDQLIQNAVAVQVAPVGDGASNENKFFAGRFGMNSGTYAAALGTHSIDLLYIDIQDSGNNQPNANLFIGPSLENAARYINNEGVNCDIVNARVEFQVSGTPGTDFPASFIDYSGNGNALEVSYSSSWLSGNHTIDHGAATRVDDLRFDLVGTDVRTHFFQGALVSVTVSGTEFICQVLRSDLNGSDTRVTVDKPIVTGGPTATVTARMVSSGIRNEFALPTVAIPTIATMKSRTGHNELLSLVRSALVLQGLNSNYPALSLHPGSSAAERLLRIFDLSGGNTAYINGSGHEYVTRLAVGSQATPSASRTHVADVPTAGSATAAANATAINAILATLEAFGLHASS